MSTIEDFVYNLSELRVQQACILAELVVRPRRAAAPYANAAPAIARRRDQCGQNR